MIVRPYRPGDRRAVRRICHRTGYMGESAEWFWRDEESFADLFSGYWTDVEPESAFVAVAGRGEEAPAGTVVGYLLGALDARRIPDVATVIAPHALGRLLLVRPGTAGVLWRALADVGREVLAGRGMPEERLVDARYPSSFHLDLLRCARGHGAGRQLLDAWFELLRVAGSPGCHLQALSENAAAIAFFQRAGFERHGPPAPAPGFRTRAGAPMHIQVMVREL
jgi:ribosomal protein S18 acetylase RimI-like enzyme